MIRSRREARLTPGFQYALETPGVLFLGFALTSREAKGLLRLLDNTGVKAIAMVVGSHLRSKRRLRSSSRQR